MVVGGGGGGVVVVVVVVGVRKNFNLAIFSETIKARIMPFGISVHLNEYYY